MIKLWVLTVIVDFILLTLFVATGVSGVHIILRLMLTLAIMVLGVIPGLVITKNLSFVKLIEYSIKNLFVCLVITTFMMDLTIVLWAMSGLSSHINLFSLVFGNVVSFGFLFHVFGSSRKSKSEKDN